MLWGVGRLWPAWTKLLPKTGLNVPFSGQNYQGGDRQHGVIYLLCHLEVGNKRDLHSFQFCFCQKYFLHDHYSCSKRTIVIDSSYIFISTGLKCWFLFWTIEHVTVIWSAGVVANFSSYHWKWRLVFWGNISSQGNIFWCRNKSQPLNMY